MPKFRKRPVVVEAEQWWPPFHPGRVEIDCVRDVDPGALDDPVYGLYVEQGEIDTPKDANDVLPGDWIVKELDGRRHRVKPDIFAQTYELVEESEEKES